MDLKCPDCRQKTEHVRCECVWHRRGRPAMVCQQCGHTHKLGRIRYLVNIVKEQWDFMVFLVFNEVR